MISIFLAGILAFIFGAVWYMSPVGRAWGAAKLWDKDGEKYTKKPVYMAEMYGTSLLITILVAYVLSVFFEISQAVTLAEQFQVAMLICFGFVVTTKFTDLMYTNTPPFYGRRAQTVFLVDCGNYIGMFTIITLVLHFVGI